MHLKFTTLAATLAMALSFSPSTPRITGVAPASLAPSASAQPITITGEGFMRGLSLTITSPVGATQVYKDMDVQSQEEASFGVSAVLPVAGTYSFVVTNTDGGVSQPFQLQLRAAAPAQPSTTAPVINTITPSKTTKQTQPQTLRIDGARFVQGLTVTLNDPSGAGTTVSGTAISDFTANGFAMSVTLTVEGQYTVTVTNPGGQVSNVVSLSVGGA